MSEDKLLEELSAQLEKVASRNKVKNQYLYQKNSVKDLGVNTPRRLRNLNNIVGWGTKAVDVLLERIFWRGYFNPDVNNTVNENNKNWLNNLYRDNFFEAEQTSVHKDAFSTGVSFISIGAGNDDEPEILWTPENSSLITGKYNRRTRQLDAAFKAIKKGEDQFAVLWTPESTIEYGLINDSWVEVDRDNHELGFVPVVHFANNADSLYPLGRSEITKAIRSNIDSAQRTLRDAEISRAYKGFGKEFIAGLSDLDMEKGLKEGKLSFAMEAGEIVVLPVNNDNPDTPITPSVSQIAASKPKDTIEIIEYYARLVANDLGITLAQLGFESVNPSSADAINAAERTIIRKSVSRINHLKRSYKKLGRMSLVIAGRETDDYNSIDAVFDKPDTITPAAAADRVSKQNAMGLFDKIFPDYVYIEQGLTEAQIEETKNYVKKKVNMQTILGNAVNGQSFNDTINRLNEQVGE